MLLRNNTKLQLNFSLCNNDCKYICFLFIFGILCQIRIFQMRVQFCDCNGQEMHKINNPKTIFILFMNKIGTTDFKCAKFKKKRLTRYYMKLLLPCIILVRCHFQTYPLFKKFAIFSKHIAWQNLVRPMTL